MKIFIGGLFLLFTCMANIGFAGNDSPEDELLPADSLAIFQALIDSIEGSLSYDTGTIQLGENIAILNTPSGYKYLNPGQSAMVLTDFWGNPPSETLGMLFPEAMTPLADSFTYCIEISYHPEGYIDDSDVEDLDYDELIREIQAAAKEENELRRQSGYPGMEIRGWASRPFYDKAEKKLHWAQEIQFDGDPAPTLNYEVRILGREGFLSMNAIADMKYLPLVKDHIDDFLNSVDFVSGKKYVDFDPQYDKIAAYGIGGLIAGKALAKVGFFAALLKFWKVIAVGIVAGFAALRKRIFGRRAG